jgi:hypothetical protein
VKEHSPQLQPTTAQRAHAAVRTPGADRLGSGPGAPRRDGGPRGAAILQLQHSLGSQAAARMAAVRPPSPPLAAPVQRKREYVNYQGNHVEVIREKLRALEEREKVETPLTDTEFIYGLSGLTLSPLDYGVIDLEDDQHLMLLYRYIRKQARPLARDDDPENRIQDQEQTALKEQLDQKALLEGRTREGKPSYRVALLGAGASIAYYVATQRFEPGEAVIIGTPQPWGGQRGPGVVAHPRHMITPMLDYLGETDTAIDDRWLDRAEFSKLVERVLNRAGIPRIRGKVTGVDREEDADSFYKITVEGHDLPIFAQEVVSGIGVGEHIPPNGPDGKRVAPEKIARHGDEVGPARRIMDMDVFTQVAGQLVKTEQGVEVGEEGADHSNITVVLSGANGGIDVAFDALLRGYKVKWIVGNNGPSFLPGFPNYAAYLAYLRSLREDQLGRAKIKDRGKAQEEANATLKGLYDVQDQEIFGKAMQRFDREGARFDEVIFGRAGAVEETDKGVKVKVGEDEVYGDILVFAQGQGPGNFALFEKFLDDLVPEKDVNHRFRSEPVDRDHPLAEKGDTTTGLRSRDNTLKIVGATAFRLAPQVAEPREDTQEEMWAHYNALFEALKGARGADFGDGYLVLSDVWLRYYQLMNATYPSPDEVNPEPVPQLQKFAAAYRAYLDYSAELRTTGPTKEQTAALKAFDEALGAARTGTQGKMTPVIATLPKNVLINDQLTPSRSQIVASTGFLPYDIGRRANFLTDDRTALATHIFARYGRLAEHPDVVHDLVQQIIDGRKENERPDLTAVPPHGARFQAFWEGELARLDAQDAFA